MSSAVFLVKFSYPVDFRVCRYIHFWVCEEGNSFPVKIRKFTKKDLYILTDLRKIQNLLPMLLKSIFT